ncbi:MAG: hypothetical protein QOI63_1432, partial [Thermoplasmata archaeon]|nr:hypothetical protein [Thermoplasmata archaeon]
MAHKRQAHKPNPRSGRVDFDDLAVGPAPQLPLPVYEARRKALGRHLGDGNALVVATHP